MKHPRKVKVRTLGFAYGVNLSNGGKAITLRFSWPVESVELNLDSARSLVLMLNTKIKDLEPPEVGGSGSKP